MPDFPFLCLMGQSCLWAHFPLNFSFSNPSLLLQLLKLYFLICKYCNPNLTRFYFTGETLFFFSETDYVSLRIWVRSEDDVGNWVKSPNSALGRRANWVGRDSVIPCIKVSSATLCSIGWLFSLQATISDLLVNSYKWVRS